MFITGKIIEMPSVKFFLKHPVVLEYEHFLSSITCSTLKYTCQAIIERARGIQVFNFIWFVRDLNEKEGW